ncbi:AMP-binding protein [Roseobacter sp. HKCCD9010]|uniref:AMP-binding protein n=1 Tax=unclassified Roseobacter TaxID=196798 RepID=UPI001492C475|nr:MULTISPECIES: AMP-binding protein [unclassified Roseobacter]MBF9049314.1 AMP-binding protein [Rhodobacterales bacterium HKCCD4356]NNV11314.1 AMP-binding protein [Roseobacter sp. HKCCD7357]NNV15498.1 AMP-binding protein [Roseobacter sp. HKCCD8768]NNV24958.1 AMP-binding protein [Roseobacter sp. HKCCD8192]NNV29215.1 AMP-binding protein [Roseobacter sp. HKCCD9061]
MTIFSNLYPEVSLSDLSITERLFQGLEGRPDDVAIIDGPSGQTMTASALMDQIKRLAGGLTARGSLPGKTIAILAPNCPDYAVVFHGVAFAGGTITTLNPTYTAPEIQHQLRDSGAAMLITIPALADLAREGMKDTPTSELVVIGGGVDDALSLDDLMGAPQEAQAAVDLDTFPVVLPYSSGTTGRPKGVMLSHRNIVTNVNQLAVPTDMRPGETVIAFLPFFHIYGMTVLMNLALAREARLVTMPRFDLELFLQLIQTHAVNRLYIVPPVALALAKHPMVDQYDMSSVHSIFSGAAPLSAEVEEAVGKRLGAESIQGYGMTEMSPVSHSTYRGKPRHGSSGQAVPNTECRIVDPETGRDMGPDEEGELWVRGPQVMMGYLNNPEATAATKTEDGWLKTGDLAVIDADGYMFIRDRLKELIKYKGFAVAPAEVEAALIGHDQVIDAAVVGKPDDEAGELPIAFVVAAPGAEIGQPEMQAHVEGCLAHYKHPAEFRFVDSVPKSASGKILRRFLRDELRAER